MFACLCMDLSVIWGLNACGYAPLGSRSRARPGLESRRWSAWNPAQRPNDLGASKEGNDVRSEALYGRKVSQACSRRASWRALDCLTHAHYVSHRSNVARNVTGRIRSTKICDQDRAIASRTAPPLGALSIAL
jgi:hypothetical protein